MVLDDMLALVGLDPGDDQLELRETILETWVLEVTPRRRYVEGTSNSNSNSGLLLLLVRVVASSLVDCAVRRTSLVPWNGLHFRQHVERLRFAMSDFSPLDDVTCLVLVDAKRPCADEARESVETKDEIRTEEKERKRVRSNWAQ